MIRWACVLLLWWPSLLLADSAVATVDSVRFRNFGIASGLSQVTARAMLQDEQGFMWIGTQDGLNRFDGYNFRVYHRDRRSPSSLGDSHITALARGDSGSLWVGTMAGGLNRLDPASDSITTFRHQQDDPGSLAADGVVALLRRADGNLWVATSGGALQRVAPANGGFTSINPGVELGVVRSMAEAADGTLWLAGSGGLWRHHRAENSWVRSQPDDPALGDLQAVAIDADGSLWVATTRNGLIRLGNDGVVRGRYRRGAGGDGALPDDQVRSLLVTRAGQLWVGTMDGLAIYQPATDAFLTWRHDAGDSGSPAANRIASLFEDRDGLIWIGTWTGGFSIHNPATQVVRLIRKHGRDRTSLPASPVRALWLDADGTLWMGVLEGGGLIHYDLKEGVVQRWVHDPANPASLGGNVVQSIARTPDGRLWVGTQGAGLSRMRADGSGFDHFRREDQGPGRLPDNVVQALYVDHGGTLWIGFESGGLARWMGEDQGFEVYAHNPADPRSLQSNSVFAFAETSDGSFWVGTFGAGLALFDRASGHFTHYRERPGDLESISHNSVSAIVEGADGTLWVGTQGGGLNRVERGSEGKLSFSDIGSHDGLGADAIGTLVEDARGRLWVGTTVGVNSYDPVTRDVRSFSASDGMDKSGYFIGSVARGGDGSIYLGGLRGVLAFHPERLPRRGRAPRVVFTDLRLDNAEPGLAPDNPNSPLKRAIHAVDELVLAAGHASVAIDYSALDFANPDGLRYSYRLDGFDRDWVESRGLVRTAAYTNIGPGAYTLQVRARDGEGGDFGPVSSLSLQVRPER
ncbi:MAG TPA: two-component regulator propeller domain-containing protein, partial [Xanthomonadales bacterium]|nr:two-component regulator propeller domain-containing protein [Xanthomonadales bacterium]